jgi:hypothetical protein
MASPTPWNGPVKDATFGMLANGFPDSGAFLGALSDRIAEVHPGSKFRHVEKARPPDALTADQLQVLTGECDLVIAAYGH